MSDGLIFESAFAARVYAERVGRSAAPLRVIPNGLQPQDFFQRELAADATDFLFVGELRRDVKGVDVLLDALAAIARERPVSATIVGSGPDAQALQEQATALGLSRCVRFPGAMPAREAFSLGRCLVVPSRAESFPYVVLEGAAAGLPLIATAVGGIPEIVEGTAIELVPPADAAALATVMRRYLDQPAHFEQLARQLNAEVARKFTVAAMTSAILDFYAGARR
jgi:glycosyltransferase involved in cell wall biosynthesis